MAHQTGTRNYDDTALVIGGGISGLLAARELAQAGKRVTLVERENNLGGAVASHQLAGLALDSGAESFATRAPAVRQLLEELGLGEHIVTPRPLGSWLYLPHGAFPAPATGVLGIPGNLDDPELRNILGRSGHRRAKLDRVLPRSAGSHAQTLGELVRVRMGQAVLDQLVTPVVSGVHSAHPDDLDLATIAPGLLPALGTLGSLAAASASVRAASPAGSQVAGIEGGMNKLTEALVADLLARRVRIIRGFDTIAIDRDTLTNTWVPIQRRADSGERSALIRGKLLVVATDAPTSIRLLGSQLPAQNLPAVAAGPEVALVSLVLNAPDLNTSPRGTGLLVAETATDVRAKALTHATAKWDWIARAAGEERHLVRLSYGRAGQDAGPLSELALHDDQLVTLGLHDAGKLLGTPITKTHLVAADVVRWNGALPSATPGHRDRVRAFRTSLENLDGVTAVGAWIAGTGLAAVTADTRNHIRAFIDANSPATDSTHTTR